MSETNQDHVSHEEKPPLPGETPKFTPPILADIIGKRIEEGAGPARVHYGLPKNPTENFLKEQSGGIRAAQREIDDFFAGLDLRPHLADAAAAQVGDDKITELRARVRCRPDAPVSDLILAVLQGQWSRDTVMLTPLNQPIEPWVHWAHLAMLRKAPWVGYDQERHTDLSECRNILAGRFLASEAKWAFWVDGDTVPPFGYANAFYHRFNARPDFIKPEWLDKHAVQQLQSRQKTLIGGVVAARNPGNQLVIQPDLNPRNEADKNKVRDLKRKGPMNEVYPVGYVGTGCLMAHRSVFEDIMKKFPERFEKDAPFNFFGQTTPGRKIGEDIIFSKLAAEAGHPAFLDLSVWAAHWGAHAYFPQLEV